MPRSNAQSPHRQTQQRRRGVSLFALLGALALCHPATNAPAQDVAKGRRVAIFIKGFDAASLIENASFKAAITAALPDHEVRFFGEGHDRERLMAAIGAADIFYYSGHTTVPVNGMQTLMVRPSPSNPNPLTPKGNSVLTSEDVATALRGKGGPRLVIMNGCETTKLDDKVAANKRLNAGFGITANTKGRAFIGWNYSVVGSAKDANFRDVFTAWSSRKAGELYPVLGKVLNDADWTPTKPPVVIGDPEWRYREPLG